MKAMILYVNPMLKATTSSLIREFYMNRFVHLPAIRKPTRKKLFDCFEWPVSGN